MTTIEEIANTASDRYEDGETGMDVCIGMYIRDIFGFDHDDDLPEDLEDLSCWVFDRWYRTEALNHGIPLSVINGEKKITDCFDSLEDFMLKTR